MKRYLALICAAMLTVCCLALAACGGGSSASSSTGSSAVSSTSSATASSSAAADSADKFVGDWLLAAAEADGITMTGDFSSGILGMDLDVVLSLDDDGTGSMSFNDEAVDVTWSVEDDDTISIITEGGEDMPDAIEAVLDDGVLAMAFSDDEFTGKILMTSDGTIDGIREISASKASAITSESALVGTWKLAGMNMMGMTMYGDADDLAAIIGEEADEYAVLQLAADGSAIFMGEDAAWTVDSTGATLNIEDIPLQLKDLDGDLVLDMGELADDLGLEMVFLFSK